jgi:hypothetical protein
VAAPARVPPLVWVALPLVAGAALILALSFAGSEAGRAIDAQRDAAPGDDPPSTDVASAPPDASAPTARDPRLAPDGAILAPPEDETYACLQPALEIPREPACAEGAPYPRCRWQLPDDRGARGLYRVWRNTTPEHRWARPGLVSLVTAAAREYAERWPGETIAIGDLDAPGPRHQTHDRGVDVDLYLEHAMIARNEGGGRYPDNYEGRPDDEVRLLRARVLDLAKILATCSRGRLRIYYNDREIVGQVREWFDGRGLVSDVGPPMTMHNPLHRFHFHMTIAEDLEPLPLER